MWDVLYAIDASTSMGEQGRLPTGASYVKIEAVKQAILDTVRSVPFPFGSRVSVMAFRAPTKVMGTMIDSSQETAQEILTLTDVESLTSDPAPLRDRLDIMTVGGATPTWEGLKRAVDLLHATEDTGKKRIKKVMMITDDKANAGPKPEAVIDAKLVRRAMVDIVLIGKVKDSRVFEVVASRTGGKFITVESPIELTKALNPRIPYTEGAPNALLEEATRVATLLKGTDRSAASYAGIASAAVAVRAKMEAKLQEVITLEGQTRGDVDLVISAATSDPKFPTMSMREYADRIWSRAADLLKLQALEMKYRRTIQSLPQKS